MGKFSRKIFFLLLVIVISFGLGFASSESIFYFKKGLAGDGAGKAGDFTIGNILETIEDGKKIENKESNLAKNKNADFGIFWDVWKIVEDKYKLEPLDYQRMVYGAVSGMVDSLGDPYTVFLSPKEDKEFEQDMEGSFEGIGAEIGFKDGFFTIVAPLKGSPAEKSGLLPGDKILKVNGKETAGMNLEEVIGLIRGPEGTVVKLTIARDNLDRLKDIEITRGTIKIKTVDWEMKDGKIAYLSISQFKADTANELDGQIDKILLNNPRGIILDLRNNPGGYLTVAVDIASRFIDEGKIVVVEDYGDKKEEHKAGGGKRFGNVPVAVLINEGSASASEILAGALKDDVGAKLVGKKTFGKGLVQELEQLKDGSALKITVAKWLTPKGLNINKDGIKPDFEVDFTDQDYKQNKDSQLEKALDILK